MSPEELIEHAKLCAAIYLPLSWKMKWNNNQQRLTYDRRTSTLSLCMKADYGAVVSVTSQYAVNQAIPNRLHQLIILANRIERVILNENDRQVTIYENVVIHAWGQHGLDAGADFFTTYFVLRRVLYLLDSLGQKCKMLQIFTDQCATQFKSRKQAWGLLLLAKEFQFESIYQAYSATSDGKGPQDGLAGDGAEACRDLVIKGAITNCAWDLFELLPNHMGEPVPSKDDARKPNEITKRIHLFFIDEKDVRGYENRGGMFLERASAMRARANPYNGDVIIMNSDRDKWDASPLTDLMKMSQILVVKRDPTQRKLVTQIISDFQNEHDVERNIFSSRPILDDNSPLDNTLGKMMMSPNITGDMMCDVQVTTTTREIIDENSNIGRPQKFLNWNNHRSKNVEGRVENFRDYQDISSPRMADIIVAPLPTTADNMLLSPDASNEGSPKIVFNNNASKRRTTRKVNWDDLGSNANVEGQPESFRVNQDNIQDIFHPNEGEIIVSEEGEVVVSVQGVEVNGDGTCYWRAGYFSKFGVDPTLDELNDAICKCIALAKIYRNSRLLNPNGTNSHETLQEHIERKLIGCLFKVTAVTIDSYGEIIIGDINGYHEGLVEMVLTYDQLLSLLPYPTHCFAMGDVIGALYATILDHTYLLLDVNLGPGKHISELKSIIVNKGIRAIFEPLRIQWKVEHPKQNFIVMIHSCLVYGKFGCIVRTNDNHFDPVIVNEHIHDLKASVNFEFVIERAPARRVEDSTTSGRIHHGSSMLSIIGPESLESTIMQTSPTVDPARLVVASADYEPGPMERQCLNWSTSTDPTDDYMLFSRLYPCACRYCNINDFGNCIYVVECGSLIVQPIHYVQVPPPKVHHVTRETIYDFFKGEVSADDMEIMICVQSNHNAGDFKLGILQKAITIVKSKKPIFEEIKRLGQAPEIRKWEKGDVQFKVKMLAPYNDGTDRSYYMKVRTTAELISIKAVILPSNYDGIDIKRENYLNITSVSTRMDNEGGSKKRLVYSYSAETENMIHASIEAGNKDDVEGEEVEGGE